MAELTITRRGVKRTYTVPNYSVDVSVAKLRKCRLSRFRAKAVAAHVEALYRYGRADLGYGLTASLTRMQLRS